LDVAAKSPAPQMRLILPVLKSLPERQPVLYARRLGACGFNFATKDGPKFDIWASMKAIRLAPY
jgi:hypothetical protein